MFLIYQDKYRGLASLAPAGGVPPVPPRTGKLCSPDLALPHLGAGGGLWPPQPSQYSADDQTGRKATAVIAVRSSLAPGLPLRW